MHHFSLMDVKRRARRPRSLMDVYSEGSGLVELCPPYIKSYSKTTLNFDGSVSKLLTNFSGSGKRCLPFATDFSFVI